MSSNNNRSNAWGWLGLILVVALIGAGVLYQREGGRLFGPLVRNDESGQAAGGGNELGPPPVISGDATGSSGVAKSVEDAPPLGTTAGGSADQSGSGQARVGVFKKRATAGTVNLIVKFPIRWKDWVTLGENGFEGTRPVSGPWLYVDGQLRKELPRSRLERQEGSGSDFSDANYCWGVIHETLDLEPKNFSIEVMIEGYEDRDDPFPYHVQSSVVQVERGQTQDVTLVFPTHITCGPNRKLWGSPQSEDPKDVGKWLADRQSLIEERSGFYELNLVAAALRNAADALGDAPPSKPTASVRLPQEYGGQRELNAEQVRKIVDWLRDKTWGGVWGRSLQLTVFIKNSNSGDIKRQADFLDSIIRRHIEEINELNSLAQKLERAKSH